MRIMNDLIDAVGWNVHHSSTERELQIDLNNIIDIFNIVDIFCFNEFKPKKGHSKPFKRAGYRVRTKKPEYGVAVTDRFRILSCRRIKVGDLTYWTVPYLMVVKLKDTLTGKKIKVIVCHPPAHVQRRDANEKWPTVRRVARDTWALINRLSTPPSRKKNTVVLSWGDLNIDINRGIAKPFRYWLRGIPEWLWSNEVTTHHNREIDVFGVEGLLAMGNPFTVNVKSDHKAVRRLFRYAS